MTTSEQNQASVQMPCYVCHKTVCALKIASVKHDEIGAGGTLRPEDPRFAPISVDWDYMRKHDPKPGGYYVVYADGYRSFSPAEAFEAGYTLEKA